MAHQFWISYHPPTGAKHTSSGDETPPIPEEELEQQKIEHESQVQKVNEKELKGNREKERQAREAEEVRKLDIELLHQRAIEAEEEQKREIEAVREERGMNISWSHHRLCDLQRQAARWRYSRPSIPDTMKPQKSALKKASSAQLTKRDSTNSINEHDGTFINLLRLHSCADDQDNCHDEEAHPETSTNNDIQTGPWRASASDVRGYHRDTLVRTPSCPG